MHVNSHGYRGIVAWGRRSGSHDHDIQTQCDLAHAGGVALTVYRREGDSWRDIQDLDTRTRLHLGMPPLPADLSAYAGMRWIEDVAVLGVPTPLDVANSSLMPVAGQAAVAYRPQDARERHLGIVFWLTGQTLTRAPLLGLDARWEMATGALDEEAHPEEDLIAALLAQWLLEPAAAHGTTQLVRLQDATLSLAPDEGPDGTGQYTMDALGVDGVVDRYPNGETHVVIDKTDDRAMHVEVAGHPVKM